MCGILKLQNNPSKVVFLYCHNYVCCYKKMKSHIILVPFSSSWVRAWEYWSKEQGKIFPDRGAMERHSHCCAKGRKSKETNQSIVQNIIFFCTS